MQYLVKNLSIAVNDITVNYTDNPDEFNFQLKKFVSALY